MNMDNINKQHIYYCLHGCPFQGFCYDFCKLKDYDNKEDQTTNGRRCK